MPYAMERRVRQRLQQQIANPRSMRRSPSTILLLVVGLFAIGGVLAEMAYFDPQVAYEMSSVFARHQTAAPVASGPYRDYCRLHREGRPTAAAKHT